jgi:signal transduction histidine kinase
MLNQIGPGLMHHEIGGLSRTIRGAIKDLDTQFQAAFERYALPPELTTTPERLRLLGEWSTKLIDTTDAFMNLEQRGVVKPFALASLLSQVARLVVVRCGSIGARYQPDETGMDGITITNDATLLMHALLNIVSNALDAMEEHQSAPPRRVQIRRCTDTLQPGCVGLDILNTGPPIDAAHADQVFDRGFTTRDAGHGQGLYLVRLVAQFCGGDVALLTKQVLPDGYNVGFRLWFAAEHSLREAFGRELTKRS